MTAHIDVRLIEGLRLPYESGAESGLTAAELDPLYATAWQGLLAAYPDLSLEPLFAALPVAELTDLLDAARLRDEEPPDLLAYFTLPCEDAVADALATALGELPLIAWAGRRPEFFLAGHVSWGTNPDAKTTLQIQPAPNGVDAVHAWHVPGGTAEAIEIADVEWDWRLDHEELISARIHKASVFSPAVPITAKETDHGTGVAGIVVGADNGTGTVGVAPGARLGLVSVPNRSGVDDLAGAILRAGTAVGVGGVILIEMGAPFAPGSTHADIPAEYWPPVQAAIRLETMLGVTVVEPAGNKDVDLDDSHLLAHIRPNSPTFSGAIVVGAAELAGPNLDHWERTFCAHGSRVDCFAAGSLIRAPSADASDAYQNFDGTSGASAIIAGVAAAVQGMALAATKDFLHPTDIRRMLRDPDLCTKIPDGAPGGIGAMPDLRKIARARGWHAVTPVGAAADGGDAVVVVHLDDDWRVVRRRWSFFGGWETPAPLPSPDAEFELVPGQPAVTSTEETDPIHRHFHLTLLTGPLGLHHVWWDTIGQNGDVTVAVAPFAAIAQGSSPATALTTLETIAVAVIGPDGRLAVLTGDPDVLTAGMSAPLILDQTGLYRRGCGPAIVSRSPGKADVVAIEDGGALRWFSGTTLATVGTGWSEGVSDGSGTVFDPGARPALLAVGTTLLAAGVGDEGWLRVTAIDPEAGTVEAPVVVDTQVAVDASGPVGLAATGPSVVVAAVDTEGTLRAAARPLAGGDWSALLPLAPPGSVSALGGVTAVSVPSIGVMLLAVGTDGVVRYALSRDGIDWSELQPLPQG